MNIVAPDVNIKFEGFLTHAGHTYNARSKEEILQIHKDNLACLKISKKDILIAILSSRFL